MMSLLKNILKTLRWFISIGNKFLRVVPNHTMAIVSATLVSQIALLLAFFLPLKVIMLLGSTGVPRYFPQVLLQFDRGQLVIWLSTAAVVFYAVYLLTERLIVYWSDYGAQLLLKKSQKIILFENQVGIATAAYQRYTRCLAGGVFTVLAFIVLGLVYPVLALLVLGYVVGAFMLSALLYSVNQSFRARMNEGLGKMPNTLGSIGFLFAFVFMMVEFLYGSPPNLSIAIISFIMIRQALNRLAALITDLTVLNKQRLKINALFFHGQALLEDYSGYHDGFWPFLENRSRKKWIKSLLIDASGEEIQYLQEKWHQTGVTDVVAFDVQIFDKSDVPLACYIVKLFNIKRRGQALHEATLLMAFPDGRLPTPRFLKAYDPQGYNCHIFEVAGGVQPLPKEVKAGVSFVLAELWSIEPPKDIENRFCRSKPLLAQRINKEMVERLIIVEEEPDTVTNVKRMIQSLDTIREILSGLPLCIYNPDLGAYSLLKLDNDEFIATHWGNWSLEPVGAGWPLREKEWGDLPKYFAGAAEKRPALAGVAIAEVRLAALMFAFERFYNRQRYVSAIELLPKILECIEPARQDIDMDLNDGKVPYIDTSVN